MKFELKTENDNYLRSFSKFFGIIFFISIIIILFNVAFKLGIISRNYEIEYNCKLLGIERSATNFKKLSKLSNLKSKQRIWEFCKELAK